MTARHLTVLLAVQVAGILQSGTAGWAQTAPTAQAQARREDLRQFRVEFWNRDHSYSATARAEAQRRLNRLDSTAATLNAASFELELAAIVALADNGHTASFAAPRSARYNRVRFRLVPLDGQFFVLRADPAHADLLGARLLGIDGRPAAEVIAVARTLAGGTPAWRDRNAGFFLESPELMRALGIAGPADGATYRFELASGQTVERRVAAEPPYAERERFGSNRWLYADSLPTNQGSWRSLLAPEKAVWALQERGVPFRWRSAPEIDGLVMEFRVTRDAPGRPIRPFLDSMTAVIQAARPKNIVLDMRMNGGGDLNTMRDFVQKLPTLVPGRLFALSSPWTFSAAISTIGYLKQAGGERVTIVGEEVGDRLEFWAEGRPFELPSSGAIVLYASERHDYKTGCRPYKDCHGSVVRNPIGVSSLSPDIPAPWTIQTYRSGRDPAIDAIVAALAKPPIGD